MTEPEDSAAAARAAYLRNQEAVVASAAASRRWSPYNWVTLAIAVAAVSLYVATVVSYYNNPQEDGPTDDTLATVTSFAFVAGLYSVILPYLLEAVTLGKRVRNLVLAAIPALVLALFGIAVFIQLGSLVADLLYNLGH